MSCFPFFVDIKDKKALVVGGGKVAGRKVEKLLPFGPDITVLAPEISDEIREQPVKLIEDGFSEKYLDGCFFVIAATDDRNINHEISRLCKERNIPINSVDDKEACSFLFPALIKDGEMTVGISTGGASPSAAAWIKRTIKNALPKGIGEALPELEQARNEIKPQIPDMRQRTEYLDGLLESMLKRGKVYIVGAGCGEYDLITVRGLKAIQSCDALVYDDLIDERLLEEAPQSAERIYMGKRLGKHSAKQQEINDTLVRLAMEGKTVVRLKGGDPFVFGRGGEEIMDLQEKGIDFEEIPGISSAIAIPAAAGIPVTHRGMSRSVHIITAHTAESGEDLPRWYDELAALPGTLVFLMGLSKLEKIADRLMAAGKDGKTPAAVISGGNSPNCATVRSTLENIAADTAKADVKAPAVIVVGDVAALNLTNGGHSDD